MLSHDFEEEIVVIHITFILPSGNPNGSDVVVSIVMGVPH